MKDAKGHGSNPRGGLRVLGTAEALYRSQQRRPIAAHDGTRSVGTHTSRKRSLGTAAKERVALMKRTDERHYLGTPRSR